MTLFFGASGVLIELRDALNTIWEVPTPPGRMAGIYLGKASIASTYGAAASIVVLVIWVYYSGQIFFFGAELTRSFANHYGSHPNLRPEGMVKPSGDTTPPPSAEPKIIIP